MDAGIDVEKLERKWTELATEGRFSKGPTATFNPLRNPPDWYDPVRFRNSQILARKYFLSLNVAHFIGNILLIHLPDVLVPVIATGNSSSPYRVFMRILSTVVHILSWYDEDPFDPETKTHRSMLTVRRNCHMAVSRLMNNKYPRSDGSYWLNQFDMAMTQWSLVGIIGIRPKQCAFYGTTKKEFEEYFYFWKVIGYCVGIENRFNICYGVDGYHETVAFFDICFRRCYKRHLDEQSPPVIVGMQLTEGVFLALGGVTPRFMVCYETFMKYWYETLEVRHPIKLITWKDRFNYSLFIFIFEYLLRIRLFYVIFSKLFFHLQNRLFRNIERVKDYCQKKYPDLQYRLDNEYFDENNNYQDNQSPSMGKSATTTCERYYFQVDNYFYHSNVKEN